MFEQRSYHRSHLRQLINLFQNLQASKQSQGLEQIRIAAEITKTDLDLSVLEKPEPPQDLKLILNDSGNDGFSDGYDDDSEFSEIDYQGGNLSVNLDYGMDSMGDSDDIDRFEARERMDEVGDLTASGFRFKDRNAYSGTYNTFDKEMNVKFNRRYVASFDNWLLVK